VNNRPTGDNPDPNVRADVGGWISGPCLPAPENPAALLAQIRADHPAWTIHGNPAGLGLWTAEHRSEDGRSIHYIVTRTGTELAARLAAVDTEPS
jgi:hypothetical protein